MADPTHVRLRNGVDSLIDPVSGFKITGLDVQEFPTDAAQVAFARDNLVPGGRLLAATEATFDEVQTSYGTPPAPTVREIPWHPVHNEQDVLDDAETQRTAIQGLTEDEVLEALTVPTISGTLQVGQTLTRVVGTYNGTPPIALTYQWRAADDDTGTNAANIAGATGATYVVDVAYDGKFIQVVETATESLGGAETLDNPSDWEGPVIPA